MSELNSSRWRCDIKKSQNAKKLRPLICVNDRVTLPEHIAQDLLLGPLPPGYLLAGLAVKGAEVLLHLAESLRAGLWTSA